MHLIKVDPRALKDNPDRTRQTKSTPQADALLLATIKAVGIVQPPVITPEAGGGNGYLINAGHRRVKQAIAAGLKEIDVLVDEAANDNGAMRSMIENIAREALNPVDQWRAIERLVALGWTEEAIGVALALPVRQIRKLRLLANVLPDALAHHGSVNALRPYESAALRAFARYERLTRWLLALARRPKVRRQAIRALARAPKVFEALLASALG